MRKKIQNEYEKAVNRAIDYINQHLFENPDLKKLSEIANISEFHFHRIFKTIIGENIGEYTNRLRMEYVAELLLMTKLNLDKIAIKTGYSTKYALSKAFKKHFDISPSHFRYQKKNITNSSYLNDRQIIPLSPNIKIVTSKKVVYIRITDWYGAPESYRYAWQQLGRFAKNNNLINSKTEYIGLSFDNPTITKPVNCRFYACFTTEKDVKPTGPFGVLPIDGGLYAIFRLKGSYNGLMDMYYSIYKWLPESDYKLRKGCSYELYINNPDLVPTEEILTDIYIPISKK